MSRKSVLEKALEHSNKYNPTFIFEDTGDRSYRDIIEVLEGNGWKRIPYRKKSKITEKRR